MSRKADRPLLFLTLVGLIAFWITVAVVVAVAVEPEIRIGVTRDEFGRVTRKQANSDGEQ